MSFAQTALHAVIWLPLLAMIFVPLEELFAVRRTDFLRPGWATDLGWYFLNSFTPSILLGPILAVLAMAVHALIPWRVTHFADTLPLGAKIAAAMIIGEIGFYWGHRWSHEIPLLWRFHAIHHSAEHIDFLVNTRAHPVDMVFTRLCGLALLYATGLASPVGRHPGLILAIVLVVGAAWSFFIHANVRWRLGPLEELIATPAFHHWHHTRDDHKDHNYAAMLPVMDRIFGSFYLPKSWPAAYGTATPVPAGLLNQLLDPFAPAAPRAQICETETS